MAPSSLRIVTRATLVAGALLVASDGGAAEPTHLLRMAAIAPEGSMWGRLLVEMDQEVRASTRGSLRIKWTFGGVAGDETTALDRVRRHELDGEAGAAFCARVAPTLRVLEVAGLVQDDDEAESILRALRPEVEHDFEHTPFRLLALSSGFGHRVLFSRAPVRSLEELRRGRYWVYELDDVEVAQYAKMGITVEPSRPEQAAQRFDSGRLDGFISIPYAAVAYRYSTRARYYTDLHAGFLPGCLVVARDRFAALTPGERKALHEAATRLETRFRLAGREQDRALEASLLAKQGLKEAALSPSFRAAFLDAARAAGDRLGPELVPRGLVERVRGLLEDIRNHCDCHPR